MLTQEQMDTTMYLETVLLRYPSFKLGYQCFKNDDPSWEISPLVAKKAAKICMDLKYDTSAVFPSNDSTVCIEYNWFPGNYVFFSIEEDCVKFVRDTKESVTISESEVKDYVWNILEPNVFQLILIAEGQDISKEQYLDYVGSASNLFPAEIIRYGFQNVSAKEQYLYDKWKANKFKTKVRNLYDLSIDALIPKLLEMEIPYRVKKESERYAVALAVGPLINEQVQKIVKYQGDENVTRL